MKRRRVTRACDSCRSKKVKCDGRQPCIHCTVYSYNCTYCTPGVRNKHSIEHHQDPASSQLLSTAAILAKATNPSGSSNDPSVSGPQLNLARNLVACNKILSFLLPDLKLDFLDHSKQISFDFEKFKAIYKNETSDNGPNLLENVALEYLSGKDVGSVKVKDESNEGLAPMDGANIPSFTLSPTLSSTSNMEIELPPKEETLRLIYACWTKGCVLFRFYHRPSLLEEVDLLYSIDPRDYGDRQHQFLPLFYLTLACGLLFSKNSAKSSADNTILEDEGYRYFMSARKLIDISNISDISLIQTVVMMTMYLQCLAQLSTCYLYIGIAMRSALKEGLHRNLSIVRLSDLSPIDIDTRKRLFYTIYKMDIYINSLLGLPQLIQEDEFDQEMPCNLDDDNITADAYLFEKQGDRPSSAECANHHTRLLMIQSHIIRKLYPVKVKGQTPSRPDHIHQKVTEAEMELKSWLDQLPYELKPAAIDFDDPQSIKSQRLFVLANCYIRLSFFNCQIMLYRPFIHYISSGRALTQDHTDPRSLIRGRNCIKVARLVVKLASRMIDHDLLVGTYWFSMYSIFFSVACLIYYYHFANYSGGANYAGVLFDDDLNIEEIQKDIEIGQKVLHSLKNSSSSSLRVFNILNALFEQMNQRTASSSAAEGKPFMSRKEPLSAPFPITDERVGTTFSNFDIINSFSTERKIEEPMRMPSLSHRLSQKRKQPEPLMRSIVRPEMQEPPVSPVVKSPGSLQTFSDSGLELGPLISNGTEALDYVPGVFDALDAQIFGRILPPYMLEKNAKHGAAADSMSPYPASLDPNVTEFDLGDYSRSPELNYLDPFTINSYQL